MAVKHPQRIDTTATKTKSDTTITESDSVIYFGDGESKTMETNISDVVYPINFSADTIRGGISRICGSDSMMALQWKGQVRIKTKTITIHDTTTHTVVDESQVNALKTYLQSSRDSTNQFMLKYANERSTARDRLIWIIVLGLALLGSGYLNLKNVFKI